MNDSMISVVESSVDAKKFVVRARNVVDLRVLFPNEPIDTRSGSDYHARVYVDKDRVIKVITERLKNIDYDNFKDSIHHLDTPRSEAYFDVWRAMFYYQLRMFPTKLRKRK